MSDAPHLLYCPNHDVEFDDLSTDEHDLCIGVVDVTYERATGGWGDTDE